MLRVGHRLLKLNLLRDRDRIPVASARTSAKLAPISSMKKPISSISTDRDNSSFSAASTGSATAITPAPLTRSHHAHAPAGLVHIQTLLDAHARAPTSQQLVDLCGCDITMQHVKHCWSNVEKVSAIDFDQLHDPELLSQQLRCTCMRTRALRSCL